MTPPVDKTEDGRYIVVNGRRWRATDPTIPEQLRKELVDELMSARRAVRSAKGKPDRLALARRRVSNAKVALGERGEPWWEAPTAEGLATRSKAAALAMLYKRGTESSICPSDVARIVASPQWRPAMEPVRKAMQALSDEGLVVITQGGEIVRSVHEVKGPVRIRLPGSFN